MKTTALLTGVLVAFGFTARAQLPIKPVGDSPTAAAAEGQELAQLFTLTRAAAANIVPVPCLGE